MALRCPSSAAVRASSPGLSAPLPSARFPSFCEVTRRTSRTVLIHIELGYLICCLRWHERDCKFLPFVAGYYQAGIDSCAFTRDNAWSY